MEQTASPTPKTAVATSRSTQKTGTPSAALRTKERATAGRAAEVAVARYLVARGFEIIATNLRLSYLELDVVARLDDLIVIVEVRSRGASAWTSAFGSLDGKKRYRIRLAGQRLWQRRYSRDKSVNRIRFDAASVTFGPGGPEVEYVVAAF